MENINENTDRDRQIIQMYLANNTMQIVGDEFGLSRERIRQILTANKVKIRFYTYIERKTPPPRRLHGYIPSKIERFWMKVEKTDSCWIWTGKVNSSGYGYVCFNSHTFFAHRLAFEIVNGYPLTQWCLHKCDNPPCVNPAHLYDGNAMDNAKDRIMRKQGISRI